MRRINRIYNIFLPNEAFIRFEEFMQDVYSSFPEDSTVSIAELLNQIGNRLGSGILAAAVEAGVPVYCPAIQDSMIGLQTCSSLRRTTLWSTHLAICTNSLTYALRQSGPGHIRGRRRPEELHPAEQTDDRERV